MWEIGDGAVHMKRRKWERLTFCADLPLVLQITLVAYHDDGEVVLVLDS